MPPEGRGCGSVGQYRCGPAIFIVFRADADLLSEVRPGLSPAFLAFSAGRWLRRFPRASDRCEACHLHSASHRRGWRLCPKPGAASARKPGPATLRKLHGTAKPSRPRVLVTASRGRLWIAPGQRAIASGSRFVWLDVRTETRKDSSERTDSAQFTLAWSSCQTFPGYPGRFQVFFQLSVL